MSQDYLLDEKIAIQVAEMTGDTVPNDGDFAPIRIRKDVSVKPNANTQSLNEAEGDGAQSADSIVMPKYEWSVPVVGRGGGLDGGNLVLAPEYEPLLMCCGTRKTSIVHLPVDDSTGFVHGGALGGVTSGASATIIFTLPKLLVVEMEAASDPFQNDEDVTQGEPVVTAHINAAPYDGILYRSLTEPTQHKFAAVKFYRDRMLRTLLKMAGTFELDGTLGNVPVFTFSGQSLYSTPADTAFGSIPSAPRPAPKVESVGLVFGARDNDGAPFSPANSGAKFSLGASVEADEDANSVYGFKGFLVPSRAASLSLEFTQPSLDIVNPEQWWRDERTFLVTYVIGQEKGNRCRVIAPKCQITSIDQGGKGGKITTSVTCKCTRDTVKDNEWGIIFF